MTDLPAGWTMAKVADLGRVSLGRQRSPKYHQGSAMRPYLRVANVFEDRIDTADVMEMHFSDEEFDRYRLTPGDILLNEGQSPHLLGRPAIYRGDPPNVAFTNSLIRFQAGPAVNPKWALAVFRHHMHSKRFMRESRITTNIAHLSAGRFAEVEFPVPPLPEQERIVTAIEEQFSRLDAADVLLGETHRRLGKFRAAALHSLLAGDWPSTTLGELAERITKGTTPTSIGHGFADDGVLFVKAESLAEGQVNHARCAHVDDRTDEALARSRLAEDDILVTIAGTLGRVAKVRAIDVPANTNQAVSLIRLKDRTAAPWVLAWLQGPVAQGYLMTGGRGVGLQNLNLRQLAQTPVQLPPRDDQGRIVAEIQRHVSAVAAINAEIGRAERRSGALRRSILEQAFRGRLCPQDASDEPASALLDRIASESSDDHHPARARRSRRKATA
jgi:type I restriction enzyme S subunit